ncbi:MAG: hypothetical protein OXD36_15535 [Rhodobacter sp.]|nr:hypothetical protein [Rhodobacter sp.]
MAGTVRIGFGYVPVTSLAMAWVGKEVGFRAMPEGAEVYGLTNDRSLRYIGRRRVWRNW